MSRTLTAAVIAALALPVLALAALVGEQERQIAGAPVVSVPLRGYDPRDLLRGHYLLAQLEWDWEREPTTPDGSGDLYGGACVLADTPKPRLRFVADWMAGDAIDPACRMMMAGRAWPRSGQMTAGFIPANLDDGGRGGVRFYIPETRGTELEQLIRDRPGALTADLAVRGDGNVTIRALRIDGRPIAR
jgi:hypothetical protein